MQTQIEKSDARCAVIAAHSRSPSFLNAAHASELACLRKHLTRQNSAIRKPTAGWLNPQAPFALSHPLPHRPCCKPVLAKGEEDNREFQKKGK